MLTYFIVIMHSWTRVRNYEFCGWTSCLENTIIQQQFWIQGIASDCTELQKSIRAMFRLFVRLRFLHCPQGFTVLALKVDAIIIKIKDCVLEKLFLRYINIQFYIWLLSLKVKCFSSSSGLLKFDLFLFVFYLFEIS